MKTIALTCSTESDKLFLRPRYIDYILAASAAVGEKVMPLILPLTTDEALIEEYSHAFDGYIFTGGDDIDPSHYGEEKHEKCGVIEGERDIFELALLKKLIANDRPVFGICRGIQIMNVALGGTLWQDHYSQIKREKSHAEKNENGSPRHDVQTCGIMRDIIGSEFINTNSYHHQAVKKLGCGLNICAQSEDGVIEALAHEKLSFYRAVQWHPEIDPDNISMRLFADFMCHL